MKQNFNVPGGTGKRHPLQAALMKKVAASFEEKNNAEEKKFLRERKKRIKSGGFKSERDYFTNVNPLTGKRGTTKGKPNHK